ncbi:hypothetical protein SKAU_G00001110 [Synaphobranchus kaupii]|uniref:Uncharacterized protein n=1 Tax=Synaphobranchus kaupii TaxID=118154 RepID=A0A9Q1JB91_SYNKA|nr:hypothetical protein SKAU_G00001110 [Synaphobranchus kaupii]
MFLASLNRGLFPSVSCSFFKYNWPISFYGCAEEYYLNQVFLWYLLKIVLKTYVALLYCILPPAAFFFKLSFNFQFRYVKLGCVM